MSPRSLCLAALLAFPAPALDCVVIAQYGVAGSGFTTRTQILQSPLTLELPRGR